MQNKKVPIRRCTGCKEGKPKKELVRVVKSPDGEISIDLTGKKSGRGAYICRDINCLKAAQKSRGLERTLECAISPDIYERLLQQIAEGDDEPR